MRMTVIQPKMNESGRTALPAALKHNIAGRERGGFTAGSAMSKSPRYRRRRSAQRALVQRPGSCDPYVKRDATLGMSAYSRGPQLCQIIKFHTYLPHQNQKIS